MTGASYPADDPRGYGVLILAGGEATRLPGKLTLPAGDVPLVARVYRNFAGAPDAMPVRDPAKNEIFISAKGTFDARCDALLEAPLVIDRWPRRGPLAGMLSAFAQMRSRYVFAVSGDSPNVTRAFADRLAAELRPGDEAAVPVRAIGGERPFLEPLAALYDRLAFARAALPILRSGRGALTLALGAMRARHVHIDDESTFANINTPADYDAFLRES